MKSTTHTAFIYFPVKWRCKNDSDRHGTLYMKERVVNWSAHLALLLHLRIVYLVSLPSLAGKKKCVTQPRILLSDHEQILLPRGLVVKILIKLLDFLSDSTVLRFFVDNCVGDRRCTDRAERCRDRCSIFCSQGVRKAISGFWRRSSRFFVIF